MFSIADRHHDKKINVEKKGFIWLTCSNQSLSLGEVWERTQAGVGADNMEGNWLLTCFLWHAQFTSTTEDHLGGVKSLTVGWNVPH